MRKLFCLSAPEEYFGLQPSRHPLPYQLGGLGRQDGGQRECWPVPQHQWHAPSILYTCKDATSWTDARQFHGLHVIWWLYAHITDRFMDKKSMNITFRLTGQGQDILIYIFIHRTQMGYGVFTSWFFFFFLSLSSFLLMFTQHWSTQQHLTLILSWKKSWARSPETYTIILKCSSFWYSYSAFHFVLLSTPQNSRQPSVRTGRN